MKIHTEICSRLSEVASPSITSYCKSEPVPYKSSDPRQVSITESLIMFIWCDLMPLQLVDSQAFKRLLHDLDPRYRLPSRRQLSTELLQAKSESVNTRLQSELKKASSIFLTIDLRSSRQMRSFIGITAHYILDWTLRSAALACKRFKGSHTADNIYSQYQDVLATYNVAGQIAHVTTDSAANMNIGPNGPIGSAYILTIGKFATDPEIPVKINILVRFLYNQEVDM